jgi:hypothetical protein
LHTGGKRPPLIPATLPHPTIVNGS